MLALTYYKRCSDKIEWKLLHVFKAFEQKKALIHCPENNSNKAGLSSRLTAAYRKSASLAGTSWRNNQTDVPYEFTYSLSCIIPAAEILLSLFQVRYWTWHTRNDNWDTDGYSMTICLPQKPVPSLPCSRVQEILFPCDCVKQWVNAKTLEAKNIRKEGILSLFLKIFRKHPLQELHKASDCGLASVKWHHHKRSNLWARGRKRQFMFTVVSHYWRGRKKLITSIPVDFDKLWMSIGIPRATIKKTTKPYT